MTLSVWHRCLSQLEIELSEEQLNTWIRPLQADEQHSSIRLMAPNQFVLSWVENNFYGRIQEIVSTLSGPEQLTVALEIGGGVAPQIPPLMPNHPAPVVGADNLSAPAGPGNPKARASLNPSYTFDTFVEGKSNQFGLAAATQICSNPGTVYNPFFICGASGLGKTHLMQAVGNGILDTNASARVMYLNSERYVHEMVTAVQRNSMDEFKDRYRSVDALLIDDIQFFAGKNRTQEEFFHTFNALYELNKQIIITCDRYPKEVQGLEERLVSRFQGGMTVAVEPPDLETRVAILISKAEQRGYTLATDVSFFIAKAIRSNVRELEGALRSVLARADFQQVPVSIELAREALRDIIAVHAKMVTIENIQKTVAEYYTIRLADLSGKSRSRSIARPRQVAMALSKELTSKSLPEIGKAFGGRDHTTVIHACKKIAELRDSDFSIGEDYSNLMRILSA